MTFDPIHDSLTELGQAEAAGVFAQPAAGLPWERSTSRRLLFHGTRWVRVAIPLAAAAALAIVFVGPSFRHKPSAPPAGSTTALVVTADRDASDCNGDGAVNGLDIECFVRQNAGSRTAALQAEVLTRRLLGI
ncbi:MAG: hypothetical protein U1A27_13535 [Phycisphaerae bacterium]